LTIDEAAKIEPGVGTKIGRVLLRLLLVVVGYLVAVIATLVAIAVIYGISLADWVDLGIVFAGGLVGGIFYWLIAGRNAGLRKATRTG